MSEQDELELRREAERARSSRQYRAEKAGRAFESDAPSREVPCMDCGALVELSGFAWDFARQASRILAARGEQPLRNDEMTRCRTCAEAWGTRQVEVFGLACDRANQAQHDAAERGLVDRPLVTWLRDHGYRDWVGGIEAAAARRNETATKSKGGKKAATANL